MGNKIKKMDDIARTGLKIIGFGNRFRNDDGFGPVIIEELEKLGIPADKKIEIIDGGTSGSDLIFHLKECPRIIIVDALDAGQKKGEIACIKEEEIDSFEEKKMSSLSLHDLDLSDVLKIARALKLKTDITIIGINPLNIEFGDQLSPQLEEKIPKVISMIMKLIKD